MRVNIVSVDVEVGKPGAKGWSKAKVTYLLNGESKWQNVMSFTNPQVFKDVQKFIGEEVEVEVGKNDKGYDEWRKISLATGNSGATSVGSNTTSAQSGSTGQAVATRVTGSNYETPAERARRQVLIVRQSSLSNAIDFLSKVDGTTREEVMELAQEFVDFVFDESEFDDGASS